MPCYHPMTAFQASDGQVTFVERGDVRQIQLPCGQCFGCRLERSRQWAVRCTHEKQLWEHNCFITLTYNDEHLPLRHQTGWAHGLPTYSGTLHYPDFQGFIRRLRKALGRENRRLLQATNSRANATDGAARAFKDQPRFYTQTEEKGGKLHVPLRYFMCGEYGEEKGRPHYHACLYNVDFTDKSLWKTIRGNKVYQSKTLSRLWHHGNAVLAELNFETAAYTARYIMKKINGKQQKQHYQKIDAATGELINLSPEFTQASRRPGIGENWLRKYIKDVYPQGQVVSRGHPAKAPRYYDKKYKEWNELEYLELKAQRELQAAQRKGDNTDERLLVKETVAKAAARTLKRTIE